MFLVVLLGLAATAAALPFAREEAKEKEGVTLPIYKPWYNAYGSNVFGSQYYQYAKDIPNYYFTSEKRFPLDNYDFKNISPFRFNYFSKYNRPEMKNKNFYDYPDMFQSFMNKGYRYNQDTNMFGYMRNFMHYPYYNMENFKNTYPSYDENYSNYMHRPYSPEYMYRYTRYPYYNDVNTYDYMYRPYSHEYKYGNMENFKNMMFYPYYDKEYSYFNSPGYTNFKNTYRPYSPEYMNGNIGNFKNKFYPYYDQEYSYFNSPEYTNFKNTYRPYSLEYMNGNIGNFKNKFYPYYDQEYSYFNSPEYTNFKNTYRPYSLEYMNGNIGNFKNTFYPYYDKEYSYFNSPGYTNFKNTYRPYSPEYMNGNIGNFKNTFYPYYSKEYTYFNSPEYTKFKNTFHPFQNDLNKFDYTYRPYSLEYMKGYEENFKNMRYPFYNNMNDYDYKPYSPEYMNFKNTYYPFQNNVDSYDYTYKPYFPGYPQNFVDMSYSFSNKNGYGYTNKPNYPEHMNVKNMYYPFDENNADYMYRPYSPQYMYGYMHNFNMKYPFYNKMNGYDYTYRQNYPENRYGYMSNDMNMEYPFYNNYYFGRKNNGAYELPENMDNMRFKRGNEEHLNGETLIRQDRTAAADFDTEFQNHDVNIDRPTPKSIRDVDSYIRQEVLEGEQGLFPEHEQHLQVHPITRSRREDSSTSLTPERIVDDLQVVPNESGIVDDRRGVVAGENKLRRDAPSDHQYPTLDQSSEPEHERKARWTRYAASGYYFPGHYYPNPNPSTYHYYRTYPNPSTYQYYRTYPTYQPRWYSSYYYKK